MVFAGRTVFVAWDCPPHCRALSVAYSLSFRDYHTFSDTLGMGEHIAPVEIY